MSNNITQNLLEDNKLDLLDNTPSLVSVNYHESILLNEIKDLSLSQGNIVDATLGGGGHSKVLFDKLLSGVLISIDKDQDAIDYCIKKYGHIYSEKNNQYVLEEIINGLKKTWIIKKSDFSNIKTVIDELNLIHQINYFIADVGISSYQIDEKKRGFSFMENGPLDMRMDKSRDLSAKDLINGLPQKELEKIFREYGEERYSMQIAQSIAKARSKKMLTSTHDIVEIISKTVGQKYEIAKHPARRVFQALRIAVNNELGELEVMCHDLKDVMHKSGKIVILTFHSLERNIVEKNFEQFTQMIPSAKEVSHNSRAKSAIGYFIQLKDEKITRL